MTKYNRPYAEPESRTFQSWCSDLGLSSSMKVTHESLLTYDEFCFWPRIEFRRTSEGALYNWWRKFGDKWGECRTVKEWIRDFNWNIDELEPDDIKDLNLFLGHDEFWNWSTGKLSPSSEKERGIIKYFKRLLDW